MKKLILFLLITIFLGLQTNAAESYQRWIKFINEPNHVMTASEMADIIASMSRGEISAQNTYRLSTGITYKIAQPDLYLQYILMCVKAGEPTIMTTQNVVDAIQSGDVVKWGNDISVKVKNYYFSTLHNKIQFIDNYSGAKEGVHVLLINGKPKIKMDCGNPLGPYYEGYVPQYTKPEPKSEPTVSFSTSKKEEDWPFVSPRKNYEERTVDLNLFEVKEKERIGFFQRKIVKVGEGLLATALILWGGYELGSYLYNVNQDVPIIIKPVEPRTMPPGLPAIPTPTTPGLPSEPRGMPPGIGKTFQVGFVRNF